MSYTLKSIWVVILFSIATGVKAQAIETTKDENNKPQIALLGMFHLAGSSEDLAAIKLDDPLGEIRQREILDIVEALKEYKPTKILVEYPKSRNEALNNRLSTYLAGEYSLGVSETYQLGFRLVQELNQSKIYAIDRKLNLPTEKIIEYCKRTGRMEDFQKFIGQIQSLMQGETQKLQDISIGRYLASMNTDEVDRMTNEVYLKDMLNFGDEVSEAGIEVSAIWWKRNMLIFKNIVETIDREDDRILVIVGSAHRAVIKDFIVDRNDVDYFEIGKILKSID